MRGFGWGRCSVQAQQLQKISGKMSQLIDRVAHLERRRYSIKSALLFNLSSINFIASAPRVLLMEFTRTYPSVPRSWSRPPSRLKRRVQGNTSDGVESLDHSDNTSNYGSSADGVSGGMG